MWMLHSLVIGLSIFTIKPSEASNACPVNEVYDPCVKVCPPQVCGIDPALVLCAPQTDCKPGYRCRDGYVRNKPNGICIPKDKCPPKPVQCGINEIYEECVIGCPPRYCGVNIAAISCIPTPKPGEPGCTPGCRCRDFTLRNANGTCIPEEECPTCPENEVYDVCPAPCPPRVCGVNPRVIRCAAPPQYGDPTCRPGCRCADGYLRNSKNKCVPEQYCTPVLCGINEVFSNCTNSGCGPKTCDSVGYPIGCIKMDPKNCRQGCVCREGYVRDDNEKCIPKRKCPSCGGDPHAVSGCGVNCGRRCSDYNIGPVVCPAYCNENGCDCVKGYVYDDNVQQCVLPKDCTRICGKNEVFSDCVNGGCNAKNCTQYGKPVPCVRPKKCEPGCLCKDGYLRARNGTCVPQERCTDSCLGPHEFYACGGACDNVCATLKEQNQTNCPIVNIRCNDMCYCEAGYARDANNICIPIEKCPVIPPPKCCDGEIYEKCPANLCFPQKCSQLGFPLNCSTSDCSGPCPGPPGCICDDNKVRDKNGRCIPKEQCPSCGGDPNAQSGCGVCDKTCSNINGPVICPRICIPNSCNCRPGYVRDENFNRCVLPKQCTPQCGSNEVYSDCINGGCQAKNCSQLGKPIPCGKIDSKYCIKGCLCKDGYLRASNGTCVPTDQCDNCKKPNEVYNDCAQTCPPQTCESINRTYDCPITAQVCRGACQCIKGYYRNKIGECIPKKDCLKCTGPHEYFSCGGACDNVCATLQQQNQTNCPIVNVKCNPMCYCEAGYARNYDNICVPFSECPETCTKPHEIYDKCPATCPPQTCDSLGKRYNCPAQIIGDTSRCKANCVCEPGYLRNYLNECIRKEDCLKCTGPNEYFSCGGACDNVCSTLKEQNQTNCPIVNVKCNPMCYCKEGFARNDNNTCVPINQCPPLPVCPKGEVLESCNQIVCEPRTCAELGFPVNCSTDGNCRGPRRCICDNGNVRDASGKCVPRSACPSCGGDANAKSGCGVNCGRLCSNYKQKNVVCPFICLINGCDCKDGFVYDENIKKCVPPCDCTPTCNANEVYDSCSNGGCKKRNCSEYSGPTICRDPLKCKGGCVCKDGYLRSENGTCIPQEQCPIQCTKPHEVFNKCPPTCPPQTCESIGQKYFCPAQIVGNCKPNCICEPGYYRNYLQECISEKDCLKCTGPNEYFSCGGACDNVCATLKEQNQTNCPIVNIKCNPMCYCKKGYARDDKNICIPIDKCPPLPVCPKGEVLESCNQVVCEPTTCAELGFPVNCSTDGKCRGPRRCICDNGNVRDASGKCVPRSACPSCGGDANAKSGCGVNCGRLCSNYKQKNVACPLICQINGCDCKDGFVYDGNIKKCVPPCDCTPTCNANEVYDSCSNGGCKKRNCSEYSGPTICRDPLKCKGGCVCKDGYLRSENGTCIPQEQCPIQCTKPHEVFNKCPPTCPPQTCESIGQKYFCPAQIVGNCKPNCICEPGYYRNYLQECISEKDCLKCTGPNEYFSCGGACDNVCATLKEQNQTNCPIVNIKCNPMCYCKKGYARDDKNICIPIDKCPPLPVCPKGEVLESCNQVVCEPTTCAELGFPVNCSTDGKCRGPRRCICDNGNVRDASGKCVPRSACPSCGGDKNAKSGCGVNCGRLCSNYKRNDVGCPAVCYTNACDCKDGFVLDDNTKKCVRPCECTPTCGRFEVYDGCANGGCNKRNCSQLREPTLCIDPIKCMGGCVCQKDYLRAKNGSCVPASQCPDGCGKNEQYADCPDSTCTVQTCDDLGFPVYCPPSRTPCFGDPGCICKEGFVRDYNGDCIPKKQCPSCGGDSNAESGCGVNCGRLCSNYNKGPVPCPKICNLNGCDCKKGFVFDDVKGKCVLPANCSKCSGPNEIFACGGACDNVCRTLKTQNQTNCPIKNKKCNDKCYCEKGYARDDNNICIPISECGESCDGDPNAISGCGSNCGRTCSDYKDKYVACPEICIIGGCECKQNYVYDEAIKRCVLPKDCGKPKDPCENMTAAVNKTDAEARFNKACNKMAGDFVYQINKDNPTTSSVVSAASVLIALAQLALFATGLVLEQLLKVLGLKNKDEIRAIFPGLLDYYKDRRNVTLEVANKYFVSKNYQLSPDYIDESLKYFDSVGENLDFSKNVQAADIINNWVKNATHGKILDLLSPDALSADTRLVLVNALYFMGDWLYKFNKDNTETKDFYTCDGKTVSVDMMNQQNSFDYYEDDKIQALNMPYIGGNFSFLVILPKDKCGLPAAINSFRDGDKLKSVLNGMSRQKVKVSLPKMKIESSLDMGSLLKKDNVTAIFDPNSNGLKGILAKDEPISVTDCVQKASIDVDENGSVAAAATGFVVGTTAAISEPPRIYVFDASRPFLYCITINVSNNKVCLFIGSFLASK